MGLLNERTAKNKQYLEFEDLQLVFFLRILNQLFWFLVLDFSIVLNFVG